MPGIFTLYNALLGTEAQILERHPHSGYSETTSMFPPEETQR